MIAPEDIQAIGTDIAIRWNDGTENFYTMERLRAFSPSASNMGERDVFGHTYGGTSQKEFPGVTVTGWDFIGGYAVKFDFSDGHNTGIYPFKFLKELAKALEA